MNGSFSALATITFRLRDSERTALRLALHSRVIASAPPLNGVPCRARGNLSGVLAKHSATALNYVLQICNYPQFR